MGLSRYTFSRRSTVNGKSIIGSSAVAARVNFAVADGTIDTQDHILADGERLDQLAGIFYGDASMWWVIAAASGIGWAPQVPLERFDEGLASGAAGAGRVWRKGRPRCALRWRR